eukprot:g27564.t1
MRCCSSSLHRVIVSLKLLPMVDCICCSQCGLLYIGEIKRRLRDHFVECPRSVRDKRQHLPVANHFNSRSHFLGDMPILGLLQCHNDTTCKLEEQHLIFHLQEPT